VTARIAVVGANGRVGRAISDRLGATYEIVPIVRRDEESPDDIAARASIGVDLLINAAGVAHLWHPDNAQLDRLRAGNIELPLALAQVCFDQRIGLLHVSSVKAEVAHDRTPYATSKREADQQLERLYGHRFSNAGIGLVIVRPLALLIPPFDTGRLTRLRWLRRVPERFVPPVRLPVLTPTVFLHEVAASVSLLLGGGVAGIALRTFGRAQRGNLADVRNVFARDVADAATALERRSR